jgi:hypothetical protein
MKEDYNILLSSEVENFISNNSHLSSSEIVLKYSAESNLPIGLIVEQMECRKKQ